ncbi:MAG: DUF3108 domain-containing protein [Kiritimatiellae bacterium]|nr:DUF3108 domain-containing protein [Kiritimatiellia bacterium]
MKSLRSILPRCGLFLCLLTGFAGRARSEAEPAARPPVPELDLPFPVGEKLTYVIYWGWIGVGVSEATTNWVWRDEAWSLQIKFRTQSNGVVDKLYPVDDRVEVYIDPVTLRPDTFILDLNEGKTSRHAITEFDWDTMQSTYTRKREGREDEVHLIKLEEGTRDLVSFMYFLRQYEFTDRTTYSYKVLADEKLYSLTVKTSGFDNIKLENYGRIKSLKMDPEAKFDGVFVRKGKMQLWLSQDDRQLLTKLQLDTPFANVRLLLRSVEGPGGDEWILDSE